MDAALPIVQVLKNFMAIKTVSSTATYKEDCWRGAKFVANLLEQAGCSVKKCPVQAEVCSRVYTSSVAGAVVHQGLNLCLMCAIKSLGLAPVVIGFMRRR